RAREGTDPRDRRPVRQNHLTGRLQCTGSGIAQRPVRRDPTGRPCAFSVSPSGVCCVGEPIPEETDFQEDAGRAAMSADEHDPTDPFRLDRPGIRQSFDRASTRYDAAAVLQARVNDELMERLELFKFKPQVVVDLGAGTGRGAEAMKRRYRG